MAVLTKLAAKYQFELPRKRLCPDAVGLSRRTLA